MGNLTTQQLAELLVGIARAQQTIIDAVENMKAGFKGNHLAPALTAAAKLRVIDHLPTLTDFPARVLLQCQSRNGPDPAQVLRDLEAILTRHAGGGVSPTAPAVPLGPLPDIIASPTADRPTAAAPDPDAIPYDTTRPG
jgi:hypothetical protein